MFCIKEIVSNYGRTELGIFQERNSSRIMLNLCLHVGHFSLNWLIFPSKESVYIIK